MQLSNRFFSESEGGKGVREIVVAENGNSGFLENKSRIAGPCRPPAEMSNRNFIVIPIWIAFVIFMTTHGC